MIEVEFLEILTVDGQVRWCEWTEKIGAGHVIATIKEYRELDERFCKAHNATVVFHWRLVKYYEKG